MPGFLFQLHVPRLGEQSLSVSEGLLHCPCLSRRGPDSERLPSGAWARQPETAESGLDGAPGPVPHCPGLPAMSVLARAPPAEQRGIPTDGCPGFPSPSRVPICSLIASVLPFISSSVGAIRSGLCVPAPPQVLGHSHLRPRSSLSLWSPGPLSPVSGDMGHPGRGTACLMQTAPTGPVNSSKAAYFG